MIGYQLLLAVEQQKVSLYFFFQYLRLYIYKKSKTNRKMLAVDLEKGNKQSTFHAKPSIHRHRLTRQAKLPRH